MLIEISPESFRALSEPAMKQRAADRRDDEGESDATGEDPLSGRGRLSS
jgi:hypothetical protein